MCSFVVIGAVAGGGSAWFRGWVVVSVIHGGGGEGCYRSVMALAAGGPPLLAGRRGAPQSLPPPTARPPASYALSSAVRMFIILSIFASQVPQTPTVSPLWIFTPPVLQGKMGGERRGRAAPPSLVTSDATLGRLVTLSLAIICCSSARLVIPNADLNPFAESSSRHYFSQYISVPRFLAALVPSPSHLC